MQVLFIDVICVSQKNYLSDLEIIFVELSQKMSDGILLTIGHDRSLHFLVFLYQKFFPVVFQET